MANVDLNSPFLDHLVSLLSIFELGNNSAPIPRYDGPSNWQTESIIRSIESLGRRVALAEPGSGASGADSTSPLTFPSAASSSSTIDSATTNPVVNPPTSARGMSESEELQLLKIQAVAVTDVCNSVVQGDFSRKVAVPVQGPLMVQLSESVNNMVHCNTDLTIRAIINPHLGGETRSCLPWDRLCRHIRH